MHMRALAAEVCGSFFVQFILIGSWLFLAGGMPEKTIPVALATGLALMAATTAIGHVSGGHFNPAITIGLIAGGRFDVAHAPGFIVAQVIGAALATAVYAVALFTSMLSLPADLSAGAFATLSNGFDLPGRQSLTAVLIFEGLATAILVITFMGATASRSITTMAPFAIGATLAALYLILIPVSGGSLNPARSTAIAAFAGTTALAQLWVFWLAPTIGAVAGGLLARIILDERAN